MDSFDFITNIVEEEFEGITYTKLDKLAQRFGFKQNPRLLENMVKVKL